MSASRRSFRFEDQFLHAFPLRAWSHLCMRLSRHARFFSPGYEFLAGMLRGWENRDTMRQRFGLRQPFRLFSARQ